MQFKPISSIAGLALVALSGCASLTHYNKVSSVTLGDKSQNIISLDAKQRVVTTTQGKEGLMTCAEPSPDALSAIAASQGFSLNNKSLETALSNSVSEGAASIGLRTQSIQLMRDAMYRLCEGYQSGSLDNLTFETLHRRFQTTMVAILAIEQITGTVRAPAVTIGGEATAGNAELVAKYTDLSETRRTALNTATASRDSYRDDTHKKAKDALESKQNEVATKHGVTPDKLSDDQKKEFEEQQKSFTEAEVKLKELDQTVTARQQALDSSEAARQAALAGSTSSARKVSLESVDSTQSAESIAAVANAVSKIVTTTVELGFAREFCATILVNLMQNNKVHPAHSAQGKISQGCINYVETNTAERNASIDALYAQVDYLKARNSIIENVIKNGATNEELISLLRHANGESTNDGSTAGDTGSPPPALFSSFNTQAFSPPYLAGASVLAPSPAMSIDDSAGYEYITIPAAPPAWPEPTE